MQKRIAVILAFVFLAGNEILAQVSINKLHNWKVVPWTGKSKELSASKVRIDKLIKDANSRQTNLKAAEKLAKANPDNRVYQFEWGYWAYRVALFSRDASRRDIDAPRQAMLRLSPPFEHEYVWLLFNMEGSYYLGPIDNSLVSAGRKLLVQAPNDYRVMSQMSRLLSYGTDISQKREAVALIDKVIKLDPSYPGAYFSGGMRCKFLYKATKERPLALKSHAYFAKYLELTKDIPEEKHIRAAAQSHLKELNHILGKKP